MTITTTADLRESLLKAIEGVEAGTMDSKTARDIAALADKVIQVSMLELKYSEVVSKLDRQDQGITPGPLMLTNGKPKE